MQQLKNMNLLLSFWEETVSLIIRDDTGNFNTRLSLLPIPSLPLQPSTILLCHIICISNLLAVLISKQRQLLNPWHAKYFPYKLILLKQILWSLIKKKNSGENRTFKGSPPPKKKKKEKLILEITVQQGCSWILVLSSHAKFHHP